MRTSVRWERWQKRRRRVARIVRQLVARLLFLVLLLIASILGTAYLALQSEAVGRTIVTEALPRVNGLLPGRIQIGAYEGRLGGHFLLRDIVVYDETAAVAARADRLEVWWQPWDLLRGAIVVDRVELEAPAVLVELRPDGSLNWVAAFVAPKPPGWTPPPKASGSSALIFDVRAVHLTGAAVDVDLKGTQRFSFSNLDLDGSWGLQRGLHDFDIARLAVKTNAPWDLPAAVITADAALDDLDLILRSFQLDIGGSTVQVDGQLTQLDKLRFDALRVRSPRFDLELLKAFSPAIPLQRSVSVDLTVNGRLDALSAEGEIAGELGRIGLSDVLVGATTTPLTHRATLDIDDFKLGELLPYPGLPPSLTADVRWDGRGTGLDTLVGDAVVGVGAFTVQDIRFAGHALKAHIERGVVDAHHIDRVGGGRVEGDATVWLTEGRFEAKRTTIAGVDLSAFRTVSRGGVRGGVAAGWLSARGSWTAKPMRIETDGEVRVAGLAVPSTWMESASAGWSGLQLTLGKGVPGVVGAVEARATSVQVNGVEQVREARVTAQPSGAAATFKAVVARGEELLTELDAEIDWSQLPTLTLRGDRLQLLAGTLLAATPVDSPFTVKSRSGTVQLDHLQLHAGDVRLTAQGAFDPQGPVRGQLRLTGLDLGPAGVLHDALSLVPEGPRATVESLGLAGTLKEVFARIDGTLEAPELEARVVGKGLVALDRPPLDLNASARLDADGLKGDVALDTLATLAIRALPASLSFGKGRQLLTLAPDGVWDVELVVPDSSLGRVAALARKELPKAITSGKYSGGLNWGGTTARPDVRFALSVADVTVEGRSNASQETVKRAVNAKVGATVQEGRLQLASSFLRTDKEGRILALEGGADAPVGEFLLARFGPDADPTRTVPPFRALELGAQIKNLPMQLAHVFVPALKPLSGSVTGEVTVGGELEAPQGSVDLRLLGGRAGTQELKTAHVNVVSAADRLGLDLVLEAAAGGNLEAKGGVTFPLRTGGDLTTLLDHDDLLVEVGGEGFPIAVLLAFVPYTYDVSGQVTASGTVTGSLRTPVPNIAVVVPDGRLCHEKTWICYEDVILDAAVQPGRLTLTEASFKTFPRSRNPLATRTWNTSTKAAGGFRLDGYAELVGFKPRDLAFDFDFDHMWLSSDERTQAQADGGFSVRGTFPALVVAGDLDLENVVIDIGHEDIGRTLAPMELPENLVVHRVDSRRGPGERKPTLVERSGDPSLAREILDSLVVDLGVHLTNNVNVKLAVGLAGHGDAKALNTLGRVEPDLTLKGDVRVMMAHGTPRLEGRIETSRGSRLTALTKKFNLEDGSGVDLIGDPLASQLNFTGVHTTRYGDVRVKVTGSVMNPQIVFESDQFDDQADIMSLLFTGKPLSELTAAQGASAMSGVAAALTGWVSNTFGKYVPVDLLDVDLGDDFSSGSVQAGKAITPWLFVLSRFRWGAEEDENTIEGQVELAFPGTRNLYLEVIIGDKLVGSAELIYKVLF